MTVRLPDRGDIEGAAARLGEKVRHTPVVALHGHELGVPARVLLKLELLQHTGSFKARGALNSVLSLACDAPGVTAASGGNHGAAVAWAAQQAGLRAEVFAPRAATPVKLDRIRQYGARLHVVDGHVGEALEACRSYGEEHGLPTAHPYDSPETVCRAGTLGLEIADAVPDAELVLLACGGGSARPAGHRFRGRFARPAAHRGARVRHRDGLRGPVGAGHRGRAPARPAVPVGPVSRGTVYGYLSALDRLMLTENVPAWGPHMRSTTPLRATAARYMVDPSIGVSALQAGPDQLLADLNATGYHFEALVVRDLRVHAQPLGGSLHRWRDVGDHEVDVVVVLDDGRWGAFEVKMNPADVDKAADSLKRFANKVDTDRNKAGEPSFLGVITTSGLGHRRHDGVVVAPVGTLGP